MRRSSAVAEDVQFREFRAHFGRNRENFGDFCLGKDGFGRFRQVHFSRLVGVPDVFRFALAVDHRQQPVDDHHPQVLEEPLFGAVVEDPLVHLTQAGPGSGSSGPKDFAAIVDGVAF